LSQAAAADRRDLDYLTPEAFKMEDHEQQKKILQKRQPRRNQAPSTGAILN